MHYYRISSSIANFRHNLNYLLNDKAKQWHWFARGACTFFGMYHWGDIFRMVVYPYPIKIFWCGGDILNAKKSFLKRLCVKMRTAKHYCENEVESDALKEMGIDAEIRPMFFDDYLPEISYKFSETPHVYLCAHEGRELEYGVDAVMILAMTYPGIIFHVYGVKGSARKNLVFHGRVNRERFNNEIKNYQIALRLNLFDGFSDVLARSVLMGQYQISIIPYKFMFTGVRETLNMYLQHPQFKKANVEGRDYWLKTFKESTCAVL